MRHVAATLALLLAAGCTDWTIESVVKRQLKAPATAEFRENRTLWTEDSLAVAFVVVDAENAFGAKLRNSFCVAYEKNGFGPFADIKFHPDLSVQTCSSPPTETELQSMVSVARRVKQMKVTP